MQPRPAAPNETPPSPLSTLLTRTSATLSRLIESTRTSLDLANSSALSGITQGHLD